MGSRNQTAMDQYFNEFVPMLEEAIRDDVLDADDPTIDLNCLQVVRKEPNRLRQQQPQHHHQQQRKQQQQQQQSQQQQKPARKSVASTTFEMVVKNGSCSLDGLRDITEHLQRGSLYGDKLIRIMLDGLEKSLSPDFFAVIVDQGVPPTWLPIVKRNNEDTPYVEFLIKNDKSDEEPFSQIADYSLEHLALSKFVLDEMLKSARGSDQQNRRPDVWHPPPIDHTFKSACQHAAPKHQSHQLQLHKQELEQKDLQAKKRIFPSDKNKRSSLPPMTTSTPIRQRQPATSKRASTIPEHRPPDDSLNDSKRVLPPRACKVPVDGIYSKYLS